MNVTTTISELPRPSSMLFRRVLPAYPKFTYLAYLGPELNPDRFLVLVHGISREADFMIRAFSDLAQQHNYSLIAPVFNHRAYRDYQRLGRAGLGERADEAFNAMLHDARELLGMGPHFDLFGFSGGAQFAHRFAYAYPGRARTLSLAAAGWYTPPDERRTFPSGLRRSRRLPGATFSAVGVTAVPTMTIVGEHDTARDDALRQRPRLDNEQGRHRLARARWFHKVISEAAEERGLQGLHTYSELPGTGHDFATAAQAGGMVGKVFKFIESAARDDSWEHAT